MTQPASVPVSSVAPLLAMIDPDALTATTHDSDWVDMGTAQAIAAYIAVGTLGSSATVDAKLRQATDSSGTGAKDITGKAITQLTQAGSDADKQAVIDCRASELDVAGGFSHVSLRITVAVATCDGAGWIIGGGGRYQPGTDLSTVDEIVS